MWGVCVCLFLGGTLSAGPVNSLGLEKVLSVRQAPCACVSGTRGGECPASCGHSSVAR